MFEYFISRNGTDMDSFLSLQTVCKKIQFLVNLPLVWQRIPLVHPIDRSLNLSCFRFHAERNRGTEGVCYEAFCRKKKEFLAIKRARVYPEIEGIPYYMMREIAALKKISHPNVCPLQFVHLHKSKLYLFFPFVPLTLCELLPSKDVEEVELDDLVPKPVVQSLMEQLLQAVRYCHSRGIIHRNIKPKHLLVIPGPDPAYPLEGSRLQLADFALARIIDHPPHPYTSEVITLWYRPPEILMGQRNYTAAVDMWSCGCIFAELLQGRPLFLGLCEIDQLLQIFSKLGLPNEHNWEDFTAMPHYQSDLFPRWEESRLEGQLREYTSSIELDLLQQVLYLFATLVLFPSNSTSFLS